MGNIGGTECLNKPKDFNNIDFNSKNDIDKVSSIIDTINEATKTLLKQSVENMMNNGFNVKNKAMYNSLQSMLEKLNIVTLCDYSSIDQEEGANHIELGNSIKYEFSLVLDDSSNEISIHQGTEVGFSFQMGIIRNGRYIPNESLFNADKTSNNNQFSIDTSSLGIQECKKKENDLIIGPERETNLKTAIKEEKNTSYSYEVKKGDILWNIIKKHYPSVRKSSDIINLIKNIVENNKGNGKIERDLDKDGIKGDLIIPGQKIKLPNEVKIDNKIFKLNLKYNQK